MGGMTRSPTTVRKALRSHLGAIVFIWLVISLAVSILMLTGPIYMLQIYSRVLPSNSFETLIALSILMIFMFVGMGLLDLVRSRILTRIALKTTEQLQDSLFNLSTHIMSSTGNVTMARRPHGDMDAIAGFIGGPAIVAFFDMPFMPVYIIIIYLFHPYLAGFSIFAAVSLLVLALVNEYILRKPQKDVTSTQAKSTGILFESLSATEVLKSLGMIDNARRRWLESNEAHLGAQLAMRDRSLGFGTMAKAFRLFLQSAMLGMGAWLVLLHEIDAGMMIVASIMLGRALYPLENAIIHWRSFKQAYEAAKRLDADLSRLAKVSHSPALTPETDCKGKLEARNLYAAPPGRSKPVLRNINFKLEPGQLLFVMGPNGAGKSTLARALVGLWPPLGTGKVLLDDVDLRGWPEDVRGRQIGYVPQNAQLVTGTIGDNISRLSRDASEEDILAAARRIGVHEAIKKMGGISRQVGPGGHLLSAGEQRKVALARAAWNDPPVYILDEPTADLDQESRTALFMALAALKKRGRSIVLIDHRPPPEALIDLVLRLSSNGEGRLEEPPSRKSPSSGKRPSDGFKITVPRT